ncbi:CPBP family glutamic-type intramembrane protease [Bacillus sp. Marseille-P3661]|uniref:CPBP family glutamic-type intramembrane protease n=1 Tax=Bacillus sp. Marseille-P3661 TaxID=1936234 RepID=UPI000C82047D|nr:CPBP family glutamic-type intramembrane protease [Bacillus sp. Marseille-P3661]
MKSANSLYTILNKHKLFNNLTDDELAILSSIAEIIEYNEQTDFIKEGELDKSVYLIEEGSADVLKISEETGEIYSLGVLQAGDCAGEMALIAGSTGRTATVRAREKSLIVKIDFDQLIERKENESLYIKLLSNISKDLSNKLNSTNQLTINTLKKELETSKARIAMGMFTVYILFILSIYTLSFRFLVDLVIKWGSAWISVTILAIFASVMFILILRSGYPLRTFGLTLANWKKVLLESFILTIPLLIGIAIAKWIILQHHPNINDSVFRIVSMVKEGGIDSRILIYGSAYALFCPIQEFITRSGIQSALQNFLPPSKKRVWIAIILSNLLFSMAHAHVNLTFALLTFIPGLFWGWMYARQQSLLGAAFSHVLVGVWIFFIIGIDKIWNALF